MKSLDGSKPRPARTSRRVLWNLAGHAVPLAVALFSIPPVVHALGDARFGLLGLAWVVLGSFGLLDLGLARATTKFVAERLARDDVAGAERAAWTSAALQLGIGTLVGVLLALGSEHLARAILRMPPEIRGEAETALRVLALAIPPTMLANTFRGVLEGGHRFDLVAVARAPVGSLMYALPLVGVVLGLDVPGIVALLATGRLLAAGAYLGLCRRAWPGSFGIPDVHLPDVRPLLGFGGWVALSGALVPLVVYLDRYLLAALDSIAAVGYYTAPYEIVARLLVLPAAVAGVLFPVYSASSSAVRADSGDEDASVSTGAAIRWIAVLLTPPAFGLLLFAPELLDGWLGPTFAAEGGLVAQILTLAVFLNALVFVPSVLLEGVGRPDLVARYHLFEFPVYLSVAAGAIGLAGATGAALAWLLRMLWTVPIFIWMGRRVAGLRVRRVLREGTAVALASASIVLAGGLAVSTTGVAPAARAVIFAAVSVAWAWTVWSFALGATDRSMLRDLFAARADRHA